MTHRHVVLLSSIASATIVACGGGAPPPAMSPDAKMEREAEPATVEEAQARIERARVALNGSRSGPPATGATSTPATPIAPNVSADSAKPAPEQPPAKTAAEPPRASSKKPGAPAEPPEDSTMQRVEDRCSNPCRALVSMRRAVAALCRMTGDTDTRCVDAKKTLADSEGRVSPCSC